VQAGAWKAMIAPEEVIKETPANQGFRAFVLSGDRQVHA
jgi:hypothetical protein